jgi:hypothetical protein
MLLGHTADNHALAAFFEKVEHDFCSRKCAREIEAALNAMAQC